MCYDNERDYAKAREWFRKAAEQGNAGAQRALGSMYLDGEGGRLDDDAARAWLRRAAMQRDAIRYCSRRLNFFYPEPIQISTQGEERAAVQDAELVVQGEERAALREAEFAAQEAEFIALHGFGFAAQEAEFAAQEAELVAQMEERRAARRGSADLVVASKDSDVLYMEYRWRKQDPFRILFLLSPFLERGFLPYIRYRDSFGTDAGGLIRDVITSLFATGYPTLHSKPVLPDCNLSSLKAYSPAMRMRLHRTIGAIFGAALLGHRDIVIGRRFQPVLFQMILALNGEDIRQISDAGTDIPQEILMKLFRIYADHIDDNHHTRSMYDEVMRLILAHGDLDQVLDVSKELREIYGYESEEPITGRQLLADTCPSLAPVCAIAKGMYTYIKRCTNDVDDARWASIQMYSAMQLQVAIEGTISVQEVRQTLKTIEPNDLAYRYLQKWVQEGTRLHDFLLCSTGSSTLPSGLRTKIDVSVHPTDTDRWVSFSTCSRRVYLPKSPSRYRRGVSAFQRTSREQYVGSIIR